LENKQQPVFVSCYGLG